MKVVTLFTVIGVILLGSIGVCFADSTTYTVEVKATIPEMFEFGEVVIRWAGIDPTTGDGYDPFSADTSKADAVTDNNLDFGTLQYDKNYGIYKAIKYFTVRMAPVTSGKGYKITQSCTNLSNNLKEHFLMTPGYESKDKWKWMGKDKTIIEEEQGPLMAGEALSPAVLADGMHQIFASTTGRSRMVRAYYGLATGKEGEPTGSKPITVDTAAGQATGSIVFTLALNQ